MPVVPCAPVQPVFGIVTFDAAEFLSAYPEFTGINFASPAALANNFTIATMLLSNTCGSRVIDANQRLSLLYLLVAHLTTISNGTNDGGVGSPSFSGQISLTATNTLSVISVLLGALVVGNSLYDGPSVGAGLIVPGSVIIATQVSGTPGGIGVYSTVGTVANLAQEAAIVLGVPDINAALGIVGRINNASEGDVSVASEFPAPPNASQSYYLQTKYGAQYWTLTARYRTMIVIPAPFGGTPTPGPYAGFGGGFGGPGCCG